MRQDKRFHDGEAISARLFARFLEESFDWLVTADPHLHRNPELSALYRIPATRVITAPLVAVWIRDNVTDALLIGPDSESEQWVADIAQRANLPHQVLNKIRHGDRDVEVSLPDVVSARGRTPVIVDDIVSSGRTMIETLGISSGWATGTVCIAIHAVFAGDAYEQLTAAGASALSHRFDSPFPMPLPHCLLRAAVILGSTKLRVVPGTTNSTFPNHLVRADPIVGGLSTRQSCFGAVDKGSAMQSPSKALEKDQSTSSQSAIDSMSLRESTPIGAQVPVGRTDLFTKQSTVAEPLTLKHIKPRLLGHWGTTPGSISSMRISIV
jgi:hypothetical protein